MTVNEANDIAERIESLIRRAEMFGKSKNDILEELFCMAIDYRAQADRIDAAMWADYKNVEIDA